MKKILEKILKILAKLTILRYKPKVIVVAGSVGKTGTKDAIFTILKNKFNVRASEKSFNNEIGVPLTILGLNSQGKNVLNWLVFIILSILKLIWSKYPEILVLEFGADKPGDYDYLLNIVKPDVTVMTAIPKIPSHIEMFSSVKELLNEKSKVVKVLSKDNILILNSDYKNSLDMRSKTKARVISFGFSDNSDLKMSEPEFIFDKIYISSFKVGYKGNVVPIRMKALGRPSAYYAGAACAVADIFNINLVEASEYLLDYKNPKGRLNILKGIKNTLILDDSYNASPETTKVSLEVFKALQGRGRRVTVLGSMLEIGEYSEREHKAIGGIIGDFCDVVVIVGSDAGFIVSGLDESFKKEDNLFIFDDSKSLSVKIKNIIKKDDVILFKGSRGIKLEIAIKEILLNKKDCKKLLVSC